MKIVYVAPFGFGEKTTVWARTLPLAAEMVAAGHEATIVVPPWDTPDERNTRTVMQGVPIIHVDISGGLPRIWQRMSREVNAIGADVVHIVKPRAYAGLIQWQLWHRRRLPGGSKQTLVLDVDDWEQAWAQINDYPAHTARFLAWQEEWGIRHADAITAASRWLVERTNDYAPDTPVLYLPNGVTQPEKSPASSRKKTLPSKSDEKCGQQILFFSRFVEVEPEWLAQFWLALKSALPQSHLTVAGNALQPGREVQFQNAIAELPADLASTVSWPGHVSIEEIDRLYTQTDCAIFPAREVPLQQAKCSVRLATTLLYGVPVVASAVGEQATYGAGGAAKLIDANATPSAFATAVHEVLEDHGVQSTMVNRARARLLTHYNWPNLGNSLNDFYEEVRATKVD